MKYVPGDSTALLLVVVFFFASITTGCKSTSSQAASNKAGTAQNASQGTTQNSTAQPMSVEDLVAPIALYPDQLLAQVLATSINPQEVLDLGNWLLQNQNLQSDAMSNAAKQAGFSPSAQYLALFPQVVDNMCQQMDWTHQLGEAFKTDQKGVMDAIQRKRTQAQQMGNLSSNPQMTVETKKADNGQQYVQIQPADPKTVFVPQYNPVTIYNTQAPAAAPAAAPATTASTSATTEAKSGVSTGTVVAVGLLSFGVGMAVGNAIHHDDYYYPYPSWGYGGMYYGGRPYYPPPYRPPVYAGYRPAYGYHPPANYRWNQYNRNVNVNVNNNYYNRFNNRSVNTLPANNRPGAGGGGIENSRLAQNNNWRGQTTYQGARANTMQGQKPGASMQNAIPRNEQYGTLGNHNQPAANRAAMGGPGTSNLSVNRSNMGNTSATMAANRSNAGTVGGVNRGASNANMAARPASNPTMNRGGDRGYGTPMNATRSASSTSSGARPATANYGAQNRANARGGAFGGGNAGSGRSEHAASSRGRSSMGAGGRSCRSRSLMFGACSQRIGTIETVSRLREV